MAAHRRYRGVTALAVLFSAVFAVSAVSGCAGGQGARPDGEGTSAAGPAAGRTTYRDAYYEGWAAGEKVLEDNGKGPHAGKMCARRSLTAQPAQVVRSDRGAWVLGCLDRASMAVQAPRPPKRPVSAREEEPRLLEDFRAWARTSGEGPAAGRAEKLTSVTLSAKTQYDVEIVGDCATKEEAKNLADVFATWWDHDSGDGIAWNVIVTDRQGRWLATAPLA